MNIGFDANEANVDKRVGSGQYAYEILRHMAELLDQDQLWIYLKNSPKTDFPQASEQVKYHIFGPKPLWTQLALPFRLNTSKRPNVFFSPAHYAPRFCPVPSVITIHDLSYLKFNDYFLKKDLKQLENWTKYSVRKAAHIITPSQSAKNDVISYYNYPAGRITAIAHGYDKERFHENLDPLKTKQVLQSYDIISDYILYLGTLQPRKNIERLIEAFELLTRIQNLEPRTLQLVVAGKKGWLFESIFKKIKEMKVEDRVIFTDYVKDDEVPYFYKGAKLYILPSLYEGFGMPLIEAMACGTVVAGSNVSSIPEVIGPGLLFNPESVDEIAHTMQKVLQMPQNDYQQKQKESISFAKQFSWEKSADKTLQILRTAVSTHQ